MVVVHVDCDCFFVQVHRHLEPQLQGVPVAVQQHNDVIACSYEARALGMTKHMKPGEVRRLHPSVRLVHAPTVVLDADDEDLRRAMEVLPRDAAAPEKVSYTKYQEASRAIFDEVRQHVSAGSPFEIASFDDAFFVVCPEELASDCTPAGDGFEAATALCARIQEAVHGKLGYRVSFGCGPNKLLAKLASSNAKPFGIGVLQATDTVFSTLPFTKLPNCGEFSKAHALIMATIGRSLAGETPTVDQVRKALNSSLERELGSQICHLLHGVDNREVAHFSAPKSMAVQMHLSATKLEAYGMAARDRKRERRCELDDGNDGSRGKALPNLRYYYPLIRNPCAPFLAICRAYIKLLSLELVERIQDHSVRWRETPHKIVLSWETKAPGCSPARRSASTDLPKLDFQTRDTAVKRIVGIVMPLVSQKLCEGTRTDLEAPIVMLGLQATNFSRSVASLTSFFNVSTPLASASKRKFEMAAAGEVKCSRVASIDLASETAGHRGTEEAACVFASTDSCAHKDFRSVDAGHSLLALQRECVIDVCASSDEGECSMT